MLIAPYKCRLLLEYLYLSVFIAIFAVIILLSDNFVMYTAVAFVIGAFTSITSGFIGMYVATRTNVRVTYMAASSTKDSSPLKEAFNVAFRGGCVMGFCLVSLALAILTIVIIVFLNLLNPTTPDEFKTLLNTSQGTALEEHCSFVL